MVIWGREQVEERASIKSPETEECLVCVWSEMSEDRVVRRGQKGTSMGA